MNRNNEKIKKYEDMLDLPHPVSKKRPQMSLENRAGQFSPFAALTGYEDVIEESARLTLQRQELDENEKDRLDSIMQNLVQNLSEKPKVKITYFEEDMRKEGGNYRDIVGTIKKIDMAGRKIFLENQSVIFADNIYDIQQILE